MSCVTWNNNDKLEHQESYPSICALENLLQRACDVPVVYAMEFIPYLLQLFTDKSPSVSFYSLKSVEHTHKKILVGE